MCNLLLVCRRMIYSSYIMYVHVEWHRENPMIHENIQSNDGIEFTTGPLATKSRAEISAKQQRKNLPTTKSKLAVIMLNILAIIVGAGYTHPSISKCPHRQVRNMTRTQLCHLRKHQLLTRKPIPFYFLIVSVLGESSHGRVCLQLVVG